jgi:hypothetical protein
VSQGKKEKEVEGEEYMNRKSRKQRDEAEVSILIINITITIMAVIITIHYTIIRHKVRRWGGHTVLSFLDNDPMLFTLLCSTSAQTKIGCGSVSPTRGGVKSGDNMASATSSNVPFLSTDTLHSTP